MISQGQSEGYHIPHLITDPFNHPQEVVPRVPAGSNVVVVCYVSSNEYDIRPVLGNYFGNVVGNKGITRISSVDHGDWY